MDFEIKFTQMLLTAIELQHSKNYQVTGEDFFLSYCRFGFSLYVDADSVQQYFDSGFIANTINRLRPQIVGHFKIVLRDKDRAWRPTSPLPQGFWWDSFWNAINFGHERFYVCHRRGQSRIYHLEEEMSDTPLSTFVAHLQKYVLFDSLVSIGYLDETDVVHIVQTDERLSAILTWTSKPKGMVLMQE